MDISPETVGVHDVVIFTGVLYRMRHPLLALERAAGVCSEMLILETQIDATDEFRPLLRAHASSDDAPMRAYITVAGVALGMVAIWAVLMPLIA